MQVLLNEQEIKSCFLTHCFCPVKEDTLTEMVQLMADDVGLVHQLPFTCDREGFAATVEKVCVAYIVHFNITPKT